MVSDSTIAAVARLHNPALVDLSDAEVVQLVAEGRDADWRPARKTPDFRHMVIEDVTGFLRHRFGMSESEARAEAERQVDELIEKNKEP
ncbi:hypothetical protein SEA_CHASER_116 [Mycobacterium phage Chaser]|nr:hypothetical protein SEA_CHASER_116 [Mycobacterium phage Chaser]